MCSSDLHLTVAQGDFSIMSKVERSSPCIGNRITEHVPSFVCVCVYILEGKRSQEKHQLICKFVTIVGIGVENIHINSIL